MTQDLEVKDRLRKLEGMIGEMFELGRMRSDFALTHFVVGQHDTPGKQRAQALAELQALYFSMADVYDDLELTRIELDELIKSQSRTPREKLEIKKKTRKILGLEMHLAQRVKEIDCLLKILDVLPRYTADQLEAEEPAYWAMRLSRQAFMAPRDPGGNLDAVLQIVTIPGEKKPIVPIGPEQLLKGLGLDIKDIAHGLRKAGLITEDGEKLMLEPEKKPTIKDFPQYGKKRPRK